MKSFFFFFSSFLTLSVYGAENSPVVIPPPVSIPPIDYHLSASPSPAAGANPLLSNTHLRSKKKAGVKAPVQLNGGATDGQGIGVVKGKIGSF
jgi:hypothetical protein